MVDWVVADWMSDWPLIVAGMIVLVLGSAVLVCLRAPRIAAPPPADHIWLSPSAVVASNADAPVIPST